MSATTNATRVRMPAQVRANGIQATVLIVTAAFLLLPLVASALYGFRDLEGRFTLEPLLAEVQSSAFARQLTLTLSLAVLTTLMLFALLVPTLIWLHLRLPRALPLAEALSVIPYVVPAVALVNGANLTFRVTVPGFLTSPYSLVPFYVILAMPLVYRAIDAGIRAMDLTTLTSASSSLGAGPVRTFVSVILPNLRASLLTGALLTFTLVLGEFALAQLLLHSTFPVFLEGVGRNRPRAAAALAFLVIVGTWALLSAFTGSRPRQRIRLFAPAAARRKEGSR